LLFESKTLFDGSFRRRIADNVCDTAVINALRDSLAAPCTIS